MKKIVPFLIIVGGVALLAALYYSRVNSVPGPIDTSEDRTPVHEVEATSQSPAAPQPIFDRLESAINDALPAAPQPSSPPDNAQAASPTTAANTAPARAENPRTTPSAPTPTPSEKNANTDKTEKPEVDEFRKRYQEGLKAGRRLELERALNGFEACARLAPKHPQVLFQRGKTLIALGRDQEGLKTVQEALELDPENSRVHRYLHDLFTFHEGLVDPEGAKKHFQKLKAGMGELIEVDIEIGSALRSENTNSVDPYVVASEKLKSRRDTLTEELKPLHDAFFPQGGDSVGAQGLPGFAAFQKIFKKYPALYELKRAFGTRLANPSRVGLPEYAPERLPGSTLPLGIARLFLEDVLDYSVYGTHRVLETSVDLANCTMKAGDHEDAIIRFERVLGLEMPEPRSVQLNYRLALAYFKAGHYDMAAPHFEDLMVGGPMRGVRVGWFLYLMGGAPPPYRVIQLSEELVASVRFKNQARELGVDKRDGRGTAAWGDYDADGDLDLFASGSDTFCILYKNEGGRFVDVSQKAGLGKVPPGFSTVFVDYDSDGDSDLFIAREGWSASVANSLYRNQGDGTFVDVSAESGLGSGAKASSFTSAWADFDRDGDLDLFVANGANGDGSTCKLYDNQGDGTFADVTEKKGILEAAGRKTGGSAVGDYNLDGAPDIFLTGSYPAYNRLYRNRGDGSFKEVARVAKVTDEVHVSAGSVAFIEDLSGDGLPDIFMAKWEPDFQTALYGMAKKYRPQDESNIPRYFRNSDKESFEDDTKAVGFVYPHGTLGAGLADVNNDGFLDVYLGNGGPSLDRLEPDSLYVSLAGKRFEKIGNRVGMNHFGKTHGIAFADFDRDGDLDFYCAVGGAFRGDFWSNVLYVNQAENLGHWLQLDLVGTKSNRMAVGTQVTLRAGELIVYREKKCGVGLGASNSPYLHFGLGSNLKAASMEVRWPSGQVEKFENVAADRFLSLKEGTGKLEELK